MSELEDLVGIYGAIDRAIQRQPQLRTTVAKFFDPYEDPSAVGWFDEFETWTLQRYGSSRIPDLDSAVRDLADTPTSGRMAARRILVIAVAARLGDALPHGDAPIDLGAALNVRGITGRALSENASDLLSLLADDAAFGSLADWSRLIETAVHQGLLDQSLAVQAVAAPCDCKLVVVPQAGSAFPAAELHTSFTTNAITIAQAKRFLHPSVWPQCGQWWCRMDLVCTTPRNTEIYHEIFSLDCAFPNQAWTVESYLEFTYFTIGQGARVSYRLSPLYLNPIVSVDEGWFTVLPAPNGAVKVDTVKRVRFNYPFGGQSLAMVMCTLGYGGAAEQLVLNCAVQSATTGNPPGVPFVGHEQPLVTTPSPPATDPVSGSANCAGLDGVVDDTVNQLKTCLDNCVTEYKNAYDKMGSPDYSVNDAVGLMADMWSRYLREAAAFASLGLRAAKAAAESAKQNASESSGAGA
jgi:hypothetical protein